MTRRQFLESIELARKIVETTGDKQATDILLLDIRGICSFTDYFVICSGDSERQIQTIYDEVGYRLKKDGILPQHHEGNAGSGWILLDFGFVILHIFTPFEREHYQLEKLWNKAIAIIRIQ
ncbi:ribosome silencing factor [Chloroflexota bacterium]